MIHITRTHYETAIWVMVNLTDMALQVATASGWRLDENIIVPVLTTLQSIPKACTGLLLVDAGKRQEATINAGA